MSTYCRLVHTPFDTTPAAPCPSTPSVWISSHGICGISGSFLCRHHPTNTGRVSRTTLEIKHSVPASTYKIAVIVQSNQSNRIQSNQSNQSINQSNQIESYRIRAYFEERYCWSKDPESRLPRAVVVVVVVVVDRCIVQSCLRSMPEAQAPTRRTRPSQ